MNSFPAFIELAGAPVVIVGGGGEALRKARLVIAAGGRPTIIAERISDDLRAEVGAAATIIESAPARADFSGARFVFIADAAPEDAELWAEAARAAGALVNVVDRPALCDFTVPSIVDRGRLTIAISTGGAGPVYARRLRERIEALAPARADALLDFADRYRDAVKARIAPGDRRAFWEGFFDGPIAAAVLSGDDPSAEKAMLEAVNTFGATPLQGVVHIVGAGPGDPDLLTVRALRLLQNADVILYDRLVSEEILNLARRDAERLFVGKAKANHAVPQSEIETRMIALARAGKMVVRLKGGDPFIFGRGGEELDALRAAGVEAHVTPGITAAAGCAASIGAPLTHRDHAQAVTFATGYAKEGAEPDLDWAALAALKNTLVIYMGVGKAAAIANKLIAHGRSSETPVAVVENGTRANEKLVTGALKDLGQLIECEAIAGPAILVIGEVAALAGSAVLRAVIEHSEAA